MFEVRRLRLLHALATGRTVAEVGAAFGMTGPAVSQQLAALEREAGVRLFERSGRRLRPTHAGEVLASRTELVVEQLTAAEADLLSLRGQHIGTVRVAAFGTALDSIVPNGLRLLGSRHSEVRVIVTEMEPEDAIAAIRVGDADLAVLHEYESHPIQLPTDIERDDLLVDPILVAFATDDPALSESDSRRDFDIAQLAHHHWIVALHGTPCFNMSLRACSTAGFVPDVVAYSGSFSHTLHLVAAGMGVALVPRSATLAPRTGVVFRSPAQAVSRTIFLAGRRGARRIPPVSAVADAISDVVNAPL